MSLLPPWYRFVDGYADLLGEFAEKHVGGRFRQLQIFDEPNPAFSCTNRDEVVPELALVIQSNATDASGQQAQQQQ